MTADYLSYQRATSRSLLGLAIQLALGLALLIYGLYGRDHASITAAAFVLVGVVVWLALAVLFDQHRRERIEAMEADAFAASDAAASSAFEHSADDLRVAAKRLAAMQRFLVPAVSLAVGAALVLIGAWRLKTGRPLVSPDNFLLPGYRGWAIAVGLAIAFVGFIFARYMSGMAKQKVWANLRAGAAYAVGSALFGLAIAVGHFVDIAGPDAVLRYLPAAFAVVLIALGAEVFLNFILDFYRPRTAGEFSRPAFDSRILGFVAAPDRIAQSIGDAINYQLGYDVSQSWFYRLLSRSIVSLVLLGVVVLWLMSSMAVIRPHERALVLRFGNLEREIGPGPHLKWPWPIERIEVPEYIQKDLQGRIEARARTVTGVRTLDLASRPTHGTGPILWTNEHADEQFFLVQPAYTAARTTSPEAQADRPSGRDLAMIAVEVPLQYIVADVEAFERLAPAEQRDDLLTAVAQRELMRYLSTLRVTEVLAAKRTDMGEELRQRISAAFARMNPDEQGNPRGAGVEVLFVGVEGVHPPGGPQNDVASKFEQVVEAQQKYLAKVESARAERIELLTRMAGSVELAEKLAAELQALEAMPGADSQSNGDAIRDQRLRIRDLIEQGRGRAVAILSEASADRWQRHMGERARLAAYLGQQNSYRAGPALFRASLYLEALQEAMAGSRVYITDPRVPLVVRMELQDRETAQSAFTGERDDQ